MTLRIQVNKALKKHYLEVDEVDVCYREAGALGSVAHYAYQDIDAVVRDHENLSIQIGRTIIKVPYSRTNKEHTQLLTMLIEGCRKTL